jgi:parallel beta-helix repeat protein
MVLVGYLSFPVINSQNNVRIQEETLYEQLMPKSYLIQSDPIHINNDSGFSTFPGSGTELEPYLIENLNITSNTHVCGINISDTNRFFVIRNCVIKVKQVGIWLSWIAQGSADIINNTIIGHSTHGIDIWGAPATLIENNTITANGLNGINCIDSESVRIVNNILSNNGDNGASVRFSNYVFITDNYCERNKVGIEVFFGRNLIIDRNLCFENINNGFYLWEISSVYIRQNNFYNNSGDALFIQDSEILQLKENEVKNNSIGFFLFESHDVVIFNNSIEKNRYEGISLFHSNDFEITYNFFLLNDKQGIALNQSSGNIIHHNNFIDNNLGGLSQAYSEGGNENYWYDEETAEGNFWNEWLGVGDYTIGGSLNEFDLYPLDEAVAIPRELPDKPSGFFYFLTIGLPIVCLILLSYFTFWILRKRRSRFTRLTKDTSDYIDFKRKIAYSKDVGIGLFRFGIAGGEIITGELDSFEINMDEFIGFCYVTVGQGQRYETGVYGPLPAPSLKDHSMIIFAFWGKDDTQSDPRLGGKQYYVVSVVFPENKTQHLIKNDVMNTRFRTYIKKFKYPNRMSLEEINFFREIVFI